jgi:putative DNA methylase
MDRHGILTSRANKVALIKPADLPIDYNPAEDTHISNWEALHHVIRVLESDGIAAAGSFLAAAAGRSDGAVDADLVKELAFLLFSIAEKNGWTKDALSFNALAQSWPDIVAASRDDGRAATPQGSFDFDDGDD